MRDLDTEACATNTGGSTILSKEKYKEEKIIVDKRDTLEKKLQKQFFFTSQQLADIFDDINESDLILLDYIIHDTQKEYPTIPTNISFNEYLYAILMSIEEKKSESMDENRYRDALNNIEKYIGEDAQMIQYNYFSVIDHGVDITTLIKAYIHSATEDFFLIHIDQDVQLSDEEKEMLPKRIQHFLNYSEHRGINFYTFVQKDGKIKFAPGVFGGSTGRSNDAYFGEVFKELNAKTVTISLSSLVSL